MQPFIGWNVALTCLLQLNYSNTKYVKWKISNGRQLFSKENRSSEKRSVWFISAFQTKSSFSFHWSSIFHLSYCYSLVVFFYFVFLYYYFYSSYHWFYWQTSLFYTFIQFHSRLQRAIMYLDKLIKTDMNYSRKLELDQFMFIVSWRLWQIDTSLAIIIDI